MRMIKKVFPICLALLLIAAASSPVIAEEVPLDKVGRSATGTIEASATLNVFAPISGQAGDFSWLVGDRVEEDDLAFLIRPTVVLAPADGIVAAVKAQAGDLAQNVQSQYAALCYIQRQDIWHIEATITSTGDEVKTRDIRVGQVLRIQHGTGDDKLRGEATVIAKTGKNIVLETAQGDFELEDDIKIYLGTSKDNARADYIGSGSIVRADDLAVMGQGMIASVLVENGDKVSRGQPLFMLDSESAHYEATKQVEPEVRFEKAGVISDIALRPGQFVQQGQALMTILPSGALEAVLKVDELDIASLHVGDALNISVDAYEGERPGTITQILPLGQVTLDTTKFLVKVSFESTDDLMIGMHVKASWK